MGSKVQEYSIHSEELLTGIQTLDVYVGAISLFCKKERKPEVIFTNITVYMSTE